MTKLKGYRTLIWNVANSAIYAMELANTQFGVPESWMPIWMGVYILGNLLLRLYTTTPVGRRE